MRTSRSSICRANDGRVKAIRDTKEEIPINVLVHRHRHRIASRPGEAYVSLEHPIQEADPSYLFSFPPLAERLELWQLHLPRDCHHRLVHPVQGTFLEEAESPVLGRHHRLVVPGAGRAFVRELHQGRTCWPSLGIQQQDVKDFVMAVNGVPDQPVRLNRHEEDRDSYRDEQ